MLLPPAPIAHARARMLTKKLASRPRKRPLPPPPAPIAKRTRSCSHRAGDRPPLPVPVVICIDSDGDDPVPLPDPKPEPSPASDTLSGSPIQTPDSGSGPLPESELGSNEDVRKDAEEIAEKTPLSGVPETPDAEKDRSGSLLESNNGVEAPASSSGKRGGDRVFEIVNCIARRTRSQVWFGKEMQSVDYSVYFESSDSSDEDDYIWRTTSSSASESGDGDWSDPFWLETETSGSDADEVKLSGDNGNVGMPSRKQRKRYSRSSFKKWRKRHKIKHRAGSSSKKRRRREDDWSHSEDVDVDDDEDFSSDAHSSGSVRIAKKVMDHVKYTSNHDPTKRKHQKDTRRHRKRDTKKSGTAAHPHCIDVDGQSGPSSPSTSDAESGDGMAKKSAYLFDEDDLRERRKPGSSRQRSKKQTFKDETNFKTLLDDILKKASAEAGLEDGVNVLKASEQLPLVFSFGDDDPKPVEKNEYEKAIDELWDEYDFALRSIDIGCYNVDKETKSSNEPEAEPSSIPCIQGEQHEFILDDEIGIVCKHCHMVTLEMRYILPKFGTTTGIYGKSLYSEKENVSLLEALCSKEKNVDFARLSGISTGTVWDLVPGVKDTMYPHQQEGFEFMWKNVAGDIFLDKLKKPSNPDSIGGCVISHAPGTGKSRLAIVFLQSFIAAFPDCRPVILAPRGMLLMWEKEFKKWKINIPFHLLNREEYSGKEDPAALRLVRNQPRNMRWMRLVKLFSWNNGNGVLGVSYGLFEKLVGQTFKRHTETEQVSNILIERPGLVIFDEGHTPRNERSNIWKVLEKVKAERRIILSGTPFQNNFGELYNTLCLVRPKFAEKFFSNKSSHRQRYSEFSSIKDVFNTEKDSGRGKWAQLTSSMTGAKLEKLRLMLDPFVHVHNGSILKKLPGLRECLIVLEPLPIQKEIIRKIESGSDKIFSLEYKISLAATHPSLVVSECKEDGSLCDKKFLEGLKLNPDEGVKTRFVVELVRLSLALRERVLVFSQYIEPLSLMKEQLISLFNWSEGKEILQLDGTIHLKHRQASIDVFNKPTSDAKVLLASTRACCEGISLTGASRVILLDVVWNPSVENQAIARAFRLGQEKVVYTYHLIASGTREIDKYSRQVEKERISEMVFSSRNEHVGMPGNSQDNFEDKILQEMEGHEKLKHMFKRVTYQPKNSSLMDAFDLRWRE